MRDGVRLHTEINIPKGAAAPLPILMTRTPYNAASGTSQLVRGGFRELASDGYIFVFQDIRGRYGSEGQFEMMRPPRDNPGDPKSIDEGTDTYDTIDWLIKNVSNNNGRAGIFGISYPGWLTVAATVDPHPALKAVSAQAAMGDTWIGDDFHHNGAFRLSYGFEYPASLEMTKAEYSFPFDRFDLYEWYLGLAPLASANDKWFHNKLATYNAFIDHPDYDGYWQRRSAPRYLKNPTVPNLNVIGWWDQEDYYGPLAIYRKLEQSDTRHWNYVVVGPWNHGGWSHSSGRTLGQVDFGSDTSRYFRESIEAPWFAYWLKGKGDGRFPEARTFQTGTNEWKDYDAWPPRGIEQRNLYLRAGDGLSFDAPPETEAFDSYVSDPANPIPYRERPMGPTYGSRPGWATWLVVDQRKFDHRPDMLEWKSEPLTAPVTVSGNIVAHLFASTTATDSDWVAKLIDVYPEDDARLRGYELMIAGEIFRGRYRKSFEHPEPLKPNEIEEFVVDLHTDNHVFLKGHRMMVQVQSTWFPVYDRNPQKYVPNIYRADPGDYQKATQRIYRSRQYPSHLTLDMPR